MRGLVAILCSGQGEQHPGMFDLIADCPEAEPIFAVAADALGMDPRRFVREASSEDLFSDVAGQVLCCTQALAGWAALGAGRPARAVFAGYSVGELAAWGCAGALDAKATLRLAVRRADVMDAAAPTDGGLAAVLGLTRKTLQPILTKHGVSIAIINGVDSFVVGGLRAQVEAACREAAARGARRTVGLNVAVPSHTPLLGKATEQFCAFLREAAPRMPCSGHRLLSGTEGDTIHDVANGINRLACQISSTIDWAACLESSRATGAEVALELGPGTALSRMALALFPDGRARSAEEFRSVAGLRAWLQRAMI